MKIQLKAHEEIRAFFFFILILMSLCAIAFAISPVIAMITDWVQTFTDLISPHLPHIR